MFDNISSTKVHEELFKKEVERLFLLGVIEQANNLEWGAPYFAQPKPKSNQVSFISNFINIDKQLKCKTYPMPKINEILLKLEGFQYATSLDLSMGYYHIRLSENASKLFTIILHWVKYLCKSLPMRIDNTPDIFQQKMNDLFCGF